MSNSVLPSLKIKLQVMVGEDIAMGPGKADLLEAIGRAGSISGAARALGMSYRRAWVLVDTMNRCWRAPLVETTPDGKRGARVSAEGERVLAEYRALQGAVDGVCEGQAWEALRARLRN